MLCLTVLIAIPSLTAALVVSGPRTGDLEAFRLENAKLKAENSQLLSKLKKLEELAAANSSRDGSAAVEAQAIELEVAKPQSEVISNEGSRSAPRWAAMVIGLDRRPDRLKRFTEAVLQAEPWLLDAKQHGYQGGAICRISGRDGQELTSATHSEAFSAWAKEHQKQTQGKVNLEEVQMKNNIDAQVPRSLEDPTSLVLNGWLTSDALAMAVSNSSEWPKMTAGGIGLYLGHADAWHRIISQNLDYGLIFEDDLTLFAPSFQDNVTAILATQPNASAWDMLYLQRCNDAAWQKRRTYHDEDDDLMPKDFTHSVVVPIGAHEEVPCTGAYILTRRGAKQLLRGALPARDQLDFQLGKLSNFRRAAISPPVAQCHEIYANEFGERYRDTDVQQVQSRRQEAAMNDLSSIVDKLVGHHRDASDQQVQPRRRNAATNDLISTADELPKKYTGVEVQQVQPRRQDAATNALSGTADEVLEKYTSVEAQQAQPHRRDAATAAPNPEAAKMPENRSVEGGRQVQPKWQDNASRKVLDSAANKWLQGSVAKKWLRQWKKVDFLLQLATGTEISDCSL